MPGNRPIGWASSLLRGGAVLGILLAGVGVVCLWPTPIQAEAAMISAKNAGVVKGKDRLHIALNVAKPAAKELRGRLKVELFDPRGRSLGNAAMDIRQKDALETYGLELPLTGLPADQVTLRCALGDQEQFSAKVSELLLAKTHETALTSGQEFVAGSTASLRCTVRGVKSLTETLPLGGAKVAIRLHDKNKVHELYSGKTSGDGGRGRGVQGSRPARRSVQDGSRHAFSARGRKAGARGAHQE